MPINPALRTSNPLNNVKQMMRTVQMAQNPQMALQAMMSQNPQLMQAANLVRSMGSDPRTAFFKLAAQQGIDGNAFINQLMN